MLWDGCIMMRQCYPWVSDNLSTVLQMLRIQEAVDECSLKTASEVLMALTNTEEEFLEMAKSASFCLTSDLWMERIVEMMTRLVQLRMKGNALLVPSTLETSLSDWKEQVEKWFVAFGDALRRWWMMRRKEAEEKDEEAEIGVLLDL